MCYAVHVPQALITDLVRHKRRVLPSVPMTFASNIDMQTFEHALVLPMPRSAKTVGQRRRHCGGSMRMPRTAMPVASGAKGPTEPMSGAVRAGSWPSSLPTDV